MSLSMQRMVSVGACHVVGTLLHAGGSGDGLGVSPDAQPLWVRTEREPTTVKEL